MYFSQFGVLCAVYYLKFICFCITKDIDFDVEIRNTRTREL